VAAAALALASGSAVSAVAAQGAHSSASPDFSRACAITHQTGMMSCMALIRDGIRQQTEAALGSKAPKGDGYGPSSLISAYKLPKATKVLNVAVVDAYNDPDAVSNVATYRKAWGLAACNKSTEAGCLTVTNQEGKTSPLPKNSGLTGWATEESLDVDMVSAICPQCHIYLVEANSPSIANLGTAVNSAVKVLGVHFVSNSYGAPESGAELSYDTEYFNHPGVAITAAAGDDGAGVSYPAASQYVTSVGGTTLKKAPHTSRGWKETPWSGGGYGCSAYEPEPSWQTAYTTGCTSQRSDNDVAADANPETGVAIYDSYDQGGWLEVGGTSVSSPIIASVYALADMLKAGTYPASYPYAHTGDLFDVTKGSNGSCSPAFLCHGEKGYDGPTGNGTPNGIAAFKG